MNRDSQRYYELLGVKPGSSSNELKSAHRDMAKVWHPDRFGHDPRLQAKAQEKLKEINEAFDILISGKIPPHQPNAKTEPNDAANGFVRKEDFVERSGKPPSFRWYLAALPIMLFVVVFGYTLRSQLTKNTNAESMQQEATKSSDGERQPVTASKSESTRERRESASRESAEAQPSSQPTEIRALPTITVTIDPSSGLLARSDCPSKTRMSYPGGSEPHAYCSLDHQKLTQAEVTQDQSKTSRFKSVTKKIATRLNGETKLKDWSQQD